MGARFTSVQDDRPSRIYRIDLTTGTRSTWKEILHADAAGTLQVVCLRQPRRTVARIRLPTNGRRSVRGRRSEVGIRCPRSIRDSRRNARYTFRVEFEWDPEKDRSNREKHSVSFAEARTVFGDPLHRTVEDPRYSVGEFRYLTTGYTSEHRLIIVAHTDRDERIRIITAREALPKERRFYEQHN